MAKTSRTATAIRNIHETSAGGLIWRRSAPHDFEVVLVRPAGKDAWCLPKGLIEKGETPADAAVRECREETGFTVSPVEPLGQISYVYSRRSDGAGPLIRVFKNVYFFLMKFEGGDSAAHDREIDDVAWVGLSEAEHRASYKSERALITKARSLLH
jgi:8-oxo-dGTP pyrophosphatase MutT (NUDIX family)